MLSTFNLAKLKILLKDFYSLTEIRIRVFNDRFQELAAYPEDLSAFCRLIRSDPKAEKRCIRCDREACLVTAKRRSPYIYFDKCHSGLTKAVAPINLNDNIIGYLFFGQVFCYPCYETGWNLIKERCKSYNINMSDLKAACFKLPVIPEKHILSASHLLNAVVSYLNPEQAVMVRQKELSVLIDSYINSRLAEPIGVQEICGCFQIGKTQLYEISRQAYGTGIAEYIRNLRIAKAKTLLMEKPEMRIKEICYSCGFSAYNYFITSFKRITGMSPNQFRNRESKKYIVPEG